MSDDEREMSEEEVEEEEQMAPPEDSGPSEAERAMQRRREVQSSSGLDESAQELLEANRLEREAMEEEIRELRQRSEIRKKEREEDEKRMAQQRQEEEQRRKAEEEERRRVKEEEESKRRNARAEKMAEFEKWKNPSTPNFVITKKSGGGGGSQNDEGDDRKDDRKSREQLEAEKKAIMSQRIQKLEIDGFDEAKLQEKAKELHNLIFRLESEKYDLEKRFKEQQYDMMELAERARQMNKVDKGGLRRVQLGQDETDQIQERFAGAPARVEMFSPFERQKDKRSYGDRRKLFVGPQYLYPAERIKPKRVIRWDEAGLPQYEDMEGVEHEEPPAEEPAAEAEAEGEE